MLVGLIILGGRLRAEEGRDFNIRGGVELGAGEALDGFLSPYASYRFSFRLNHDFSPDLSSAIGVEAFGQISSVAIAPFWPRYPARNIWDLESEDLSKSNSVSDVRVSRAYLKWSSGRLDAMAGLMDFDWGSSCFYRPTDVFFPLPPFSWIQDQSLASEGFDGKCFLFDDLSLEAAGRFLEAGRDEWVVRLVDKSVAYRVVPSFISLTGRVGTGLELLATFPDFKAWGEGVYWLEPTSSSRTFGRNLEATLGVSTIRDGANFTLEVFTDGTGRILGWASSGGVAAAYLFASVEKEFTGQWSVSTALVKSADGGPFLFWPKIKMPGLGGRLETAFQGQIPMGSDPGALALFPARVGVSVAMVY